MTDSTMGEPSSGGRALDSKYCSGCGIVIHREAEHCPKCGAPQAGMAGNKSRVAAALLALFLGGFGVHKFYLGRVGWGVLYLLFFWTFVPAIVAFVEFIIYLTMTDAAFKKKYG